MTLEGRIRKYMPGRVRTVNAAEEEKVAQTISKVCEAVDGLSFENVAGVLEVVGVISQGSIPKFV